MRKLFVSVPMKGYTLDEIQSNQTKMHFLAEKHFNEKFELIDSIILDEPPMNCNFGLWYLSKSLEKLSIADFFIGIEDSNNFVGCMLERLAAKTYNIKSYIIDWKKFLATTEDF